MRMFPDSDRPRRDLISGGVPHMEDEREVGLQRVDGTNFRSDCAEPDALSSIRLHLAVLHL